MTKKIHYGFVVVACCCLMMGINIGLTFSCAGIFYQPVCQTLGVKVGVFGLYMSIMYIASSLFLPYAGKLIEKYSARTLLTISSALMGLTFLCMAFFTRVWEFYAAGGVLGVTVAFLLYLSFPTLINRWFRTNVGLLVGICAAASGIGGMAFNPIAGIIIENYGWQWAYVAFAAIILLVDTPLLWIFLRDYPRDKGLEPFGKERAGRTEGSAAQLPSVPYTKARRMPVFYGIIVFSFLMMAISTLNLFIPKYVQSLSFSIEQASYVASAVMAGVTIGKLVLGRINDRNCTLGVAITTGFGIAGLLLLICGRTGLWILMGGAFLFGWAYAGVTVQTAMLTRTVFGGADYARIYAIVSIALAAGGAVASGGWGLIVDATSYLCIFWIGVAMLAVSLLLGVMALRRGQSV